MFAAAGAFFFDAAGTFFFDAAGACFLFLVLVKVVGGTGLPTGLLFVMKAESGRG